MQDLTFYSRRKLCGQIGCEWGELKELAEHVGRFYQSFDEEKPGKPPTEWRHLDVPHLSLKKIQRRIATFLRLRVSLPETMQGGVRGRSPKTNAGFHLGQKVVFKLDIRNCFPSIGPTKVFRVFRSLGFSDEISRVLTKLTTFQHRLPQGAPTSSILANLVLLPLHDEIQRVCGLLGVRCTFFVDDITLSGDRAREVAGLVIGIVRRRGFSLRARKVCLLACHREAQRVTGVLVNGRRMSVGRNRLSWLRSRILWLSRSENIADADLRSIRSAISQIAHISSVQGRALSRLAKARLPAQGLPVKPSSVPARFHRCKSTRKHSRKRKAHARVQLANAFAGYGGSAPWKPGCAFTRSIHATTAG